MYFTIFEDQKAIKDDSYARQNEKLELYELACFRFSSDKSEALTIKLE